MKRHRLPLLFIPLLLLSTSCGSLSFFRGSTNARTASLQALATTTRTAKLLVTAAAALADAGVISEPQWRKIAAASVNAGNALQAWHDALKANKDASEYQAVVAQALAVLEALMPEPTGKRSAMTLVPPISPVETPAAIRQLTNPSSFRIAA